MAEEKREEPTLVMRLKSMEKIEDRVHQWLILDEHYTQHNLNRREQVDIAKQYFQTIITEIKAAYKTCPAYSEV